MEKLAYVEPILDKVVLTTSERVAACDIISSDPHPPCDTAAPTMEPDDPS